MWEVDGLIFLDKMLSTSRLSKLPSPPKMHPCLLSFAFCEETKAPIYTYAIPLQPLEHERVQPYLAPSSSIASRSRCYCPLSRRQSSNSLFLDEEDHDRSDSLAEEENRDSDRASACTRRLVEDLSLLPMCQNCVACFLLLHFSEILRCWKKGWSQWNYDISDYNFVFIT